MIRMEAEYVENIYYCYVKMPKQIPKEVVPENLMRERGRELL